MGRKIRELIPKPRSTFIKVKCPDCGNEQVVYSKASTTVKCNICSKPIAEPTGGKIRLIGTVTAKLE